MGRVVYTVLKYLKMNMYLLLFMDATRAIIGGPDDWMSVTRV